MDDWHSRLARDIVAETRVGRLDDAEAMLEVAFGNARAALTYALELARAHRLPAAGSVVGDQLWMRLGDGRVQLTLNRRASVVEADVSLASQSEDRAGGSGAAAKTKRVRWREDERALFDDQGAATDLGAVARSAIDALIADWKARPAPPKALSSAPPPEFEETPTRP